MTEHLRSTAEDVAAHFLGLEVLEPMGAGCIGAVYTVRHLKLAADNLAQQQQEFEARLDLNRIPNLPSERGGNLTEWVLGN